jgi:hypothetical protein
MAPMNRSARAKHWQRLVDRFHSSGLSVAQFTERSPLGTPNSKTCAHVGQADMGRTLEVAWPPLNE